jgi:hypothetical protein
MVNGVRDLTFGTVVPGVPSTVARTDMTNTGRFDLAGSPLAQVQLTFTLPLTMAGPAGATMPISFGGGSGGFSWFPSAFLMVGFDPSTPFTSRLGLNGRAYVFLGGTASPAPTQRAGNYAGQITLTVAYTGQ